MVMYAGKHNEIGLTEFEGINNLVCSSDGVLSSIKTKNYTLYSVPDPHKEGVGHFIFNFLFKPILALDSSHQILEARIPLEFNDYAKNRNKLLSELGKLSEFKINKLRLRDVFFAFFRRRLLKEIAYGKNIAVAFYRGISGKNYLEFIYSESPKSELSKIQKGLKKLLLAKPLIKRVW